MLYSRTQDPQTFSVPTEKQTRGNQSRVLVGTVTLPSTIQMIQMQTTVRPGSKPSLSGSLLCSRQPQVEWLKVTKSLKMATGHLSSSSTLRSDNIPGQHSHSSTPKDDIQTTFKQPKEGFLTSAENSADSGFFQ